MQEVFQRSLLTEVEVVFQAIANEQDTTNGVGKSCSRRISIRRTIISSESTMSSGLGNSRAAEAFLPLK